MMVALSRPRLAIVFAAAVLAAALAAALWPGAPRAAELAAAGNAADGQWKGTFTAAGDSVCRLREWAIKATVRDGRAAFVFGPPDARTVLHAEIGADGGVKALGTHAKVGREMVIQGRFSGNAFQGTFKIGVGKCYGTVFAAATGAPETTLAQGGPKPAVTEKTRSVSGAAADTKFWQEIQHSTNLGDFMTYLERYPNGIFVKLAEAQMRALIARQGDAAAAAAGEAAGAGGADEFAGIEFGRYHALVIGINDYKHLPKLETAVRDAKAVAALLKKDYGFKVRLLTDPSRGAIIDAFDDYLSKLTDKDNLLIYYAGHGWLDEATDRGYWLPVDAREGRRSNWLSNATITDTLKSLAAKHVMVVADSCFSGTLTRAAAVGLRDKNYLKRMAEKQARVAMVSGGLEPVADDAGGGNSPFASAFMAALRSNKDVIDGTRLFSEIRRPVILNAKQTPEYSDVRQAGHDGGDFLFVKRK